MKTSAAYVLLLFAVTPHCLSAQTHEVAPFVKGPDRGATVKSSQKREGNGTFPSIPSSMVLGKDVKFESYEVRTYSAGEDGDPLQAFEIMKNGHRIYSKVDDDGVRYSVGCTYDDAAGNLEIKAGKDITGAGKPNLVISDWSGGAHCCFTYSVFELNDQARLVGNINAEDGDLCRFQEERNGKVDFLVNDWTFAYWKASFADSPAPQIILRYQPGDYKVATDLMMKSPPSREGFHQLVDKGRSIRLNDQGEPTSEFWKIMLDLIYSGHADLAWKFCDESWPGPAKAKEPFLDEFRFLLSKSPYWSAIKAMNGL